MIKTLLPMWEAHIKKKRFVANKGQMSFLKYENTTNPEQIYLFESVIDLMSYRTLNPEQKGTFVSIQGSAMSNRFNELDLNNYKNVVCCFDNDEQGKKYDEKVKEIFPNATIQKSISKDFNDDLVKRTIEQKTIAIENEKSIKPTEIKTIVKPKLAFGKKTKGLTRWFLLL